METKYGIISDIHRVDPRVVFLAIDYFKQKGTNGIILNGDIVGDQYAELSPKDYLALVLDHAGKSNIETFVQPGSHEEVAETEPVIEALQNRYPNLIYTIEQSKNEKPDHHLVFLPGSDWRFANALHTGYALERGEHQTGLYKTPAGHLRLTNMEDLRKLVTDPDKTILVCHIPRKFSNVETAVDYAHYLDIMHVNLSGEPRLKPEGILPAVMRPQFEAAGNPVLRFDSTPQTEEKIIQFARKYSPKKSISIAVERKEDRGNADLEELTTELGIKKYITGHFHEATHRAHDRMGAPRRQGELGDELFWMASHADSGKIGILTVKDNKVAYENIDLTEYLR